MELTLAHHTDQHDTQISITCDGQFSHTFDMLTLVPNSEDHVPQPLADPIAYGKAIYQALFPVGTPSQLALSKGAERLLLVLTNEDLDAIAWEYAYGPTGFLVLECRFVRGLPVEQRIDPPVLDNGLHLVAVPSNPLSREVTALNIEGEWTRLKEIIKGVSASLKLERTRPATLDQLRNLVANQRNRVVHFMGHGQQSATGGTVLCFEKENGDLERVPARQFALRMHGTVFLVTLNACESATPGPDPDVFNNLAATLVRQQTPYALGMRTEIHDEDARTFARKFYGELAHGSAVEEALFQARWSLVESKQPWAIGIPVLYTSLKAAAPGFKATEGMPIIQEHQPRLDLYALPRVVGTFQGRIDELKALGADLTGDSRPGIVTIHGGGGQGKTALAREAVERFAYAWSDGVWTTSLEHLPGRSDLAADLARFLGITTRSILDPKELERQVLDRLSLLRTLLVLDNAETLVEAVDARDPAAINLAEFLQQLPGASVSLLVTSRIPLGWNGEVAHELGGLSRGEGAVLFQQSAPQRSQDIRTPDDVARAEGLSETLEGHPLSLRLLGSTFNASTLSLKDFIAQYETELEQAENKYIGLKHRQRTLYACIDTSVRHLDAQLRSLLSGLWIFQAPFLPQVAAAIFDPQTGNTAQSAVYDQLRTLQQRSLLVQETLTADNQTRQLYHLLPTTRPYVEHQLAQAYEGEELLQRFGTQYARFVEDLFNSLALQAITVTLAHRTRADLEQGKDHVTGIQQGYYLLHWAWILQRLGNTRYAQKLLEQALKIAQQEDTQESTALQAFVLDYLGIIYENTGEPEKAFSIYEQQVLPLLDEIKDQASKAAILTNMAGVYQEIGQPDRAIQLYNQALTIRREVHDRYGEATTLNNLAWVYQLTGELDTALNLYQQQVLPLRREVHDRSGEAITLNNIAGVYDLAGQFEQALEYYQQALPLYRAMGDRFGEAIALNNIGQVYQKMGHFNEALKCHREAEPIRIEVNDQVGLASTYNNIGAVYQRMGQREKALEYYEQSLPLIRKTGNRTGEATILSNMAVLYQALEKNDQALTCNKDALSIMREIRNRPGEGITLNNLGRLYQNTDQFEQALDSYQQALPIMREIGNHAIESIILKNIAALLNDHLNRQAEALPYMEQAIAVLEQAGLKQDALGRTVEDLRKVLDGMRTNKQPPQAQ